MAIYKYKIHEFFDSYTLLEYLNYMKLGNTKIKEFKDSFKLNNKKIDYNQKLKKNDILVLETDENLNLKPYPKDIKILYEDSYLLIIDKESNLAIHTDGADNISNTLSNMVSYYYTLNNIDLPVWYIHRLDFDTTGIIVFAKDPLTMSKLSYDLSIHKFRREYLALVHGIVDSDFVIDKPIGRNRHVNGKYIVSKTGKKAITYVYKEKTYKKISLVRLRLETGRTHQIRVHMASVGHQLLGDSLYNGSTKDIKRQALHSAYLEIESPITKEIVKIESKLPEDMQKIIKKEENR